MYDSDEVRDKVRREMVRFSMAPGAHKVELPAEERAALDEAGAAYAWAVQVALDEHRARRAESAAEAVTRFTEACRNLSEKLVNELFEALGPWFREWAEWLKEFGESVVGGLVAGIGDGWSRRDGGGFSWRRRPRRPVVRPVRGVDAVAAGRSPGMIVRTRIRGGRR
jgi:hypothetical protein